MKKKIILIGFIASLALIVIWLRSKKSETVAQTFGYGYKRQESQSISTGDVKRFGLLDHQGMFQEVYNIKNKTLIFVAHKNNCDFLLKDNLKIESEFKKYKDLVVFYVNSDHRLTREDYAKFTKASILLDESQTISKSLKFNNAGDFTVIDSNSWKVLETGKISQFSKHSKFNSCPLDLNHPQNISYVKDIAPIFIDKCLSCHSKENKILPTFDSYNKIKNWQQMILETLYMERMPPTSHDSYYDIYRNDIELSPEEKNLLVTWMESPSSDVTDIDPISTYNKKRNRSRKQYEQIYQVKMDKPHNIPPGGEIIYQFFQLGGPTPFDMWIKSARATSTNPRQLHHEGLLITSKPLKFYATLSEELYPVDKKEVEHNMDGTSFPYILRTVETYEKDKNRYYSKLNVFGGGKREDNTFPKKIFNFIPKGSYLILEAHYMGTGKYDSEQTEITFYGKKEKPKDFKIFHTAKVASGELTIPANKANVEIATKQWTAEEDISIISFSGHLHMRGKAIKMIKFDKNKKSSIVLSLPKYYYGWHTGIALRPVEPIEIKKGEKLQVFCRYDNTSANQFNPDPSKEVHFGQRVDRAEMCKISFSYITEDGN